MEKNSFTIIGGDLRNLMLGGLLHKENCRVNMYGFKNAGFETSLTECSNLEEAIDNSDVIIGPLPCTNDNETLNAPLHSEKIYIKDVFKSIKKNQLFIAGLISEKAMNLAQVCGVHAVDLLKREEMAVLNAIPTAEGAIQIAMEELPITLHDSNVLILGYGRVGKALAKMLQGLGAHVYVEARKFHGLAWIGSYGYNAVYLNDMSDKLGFMNVVFNTIPHMILDEKLLSKLSSDCLVIDLASKPGGVDLDSARVLGIKTIWALSLPGKVAPLSAANYLKVTIENIISELGV
ncbi:MAG: dipicolinate synthase subunit DpsA [Eubacteriales bacterium]|nr:dipicolinate synthase subunit DpsA [Eubacteriales bacterium]